MNSNRLMYISMVAFVAIGSFVFVDLPNETIPPKVLSFNVPRNLPQLPVLNPTATFPVVSAQAVFAMDVDSGVALYEKAPDAPFLPASITKVITSLVALDYFQHEQVITIVNPAVDGHKMGLVVGEQITVDNLLNGLLVASANDAAVVLAQNYPGGLVSFVEKMNEKVAQIGLTDTNFTNPAGLDDFTQVTTARDMTLAALYAMQIKDFSDIVAKKEMVVTSVDGKIVHKLKNTNELLGLDGFVGVKTGWTENARENLISYYEKDGRKIGLTVLGSQDRFGESEQLVSWILANYTWQPVLGPEQ